MKRRGAAACALLVALIAGVGALGCGGGKEVILRTAAGVEATAEDIDREPLWLLPPGGIGWLHLEVGPAASSKRSCGSKLSPSRLKGSLRSSSI